MKSNTLIWSGFSERLKWKSFNLFKRNMRCEFNSLFKKAGMLNRHPKRTVETKQKDIYLDVFLFLSVKIRIISEALEIQGCEPIRGMILLPIYYFLRIVPWYASNLKRENNHTQARHVGKQTISYKQHKSGVSIRPQREQTGRRFFMPECYAVGQKKSSV